MRHNLLGLIGILLATAATHAADSPTIHLYAAGSLRAPMTEIANAYATAYGTVTSVNLPPDLAVVADYGLTVLDGANKVDASRFALFILSPTAQKIFADHGFEAPLLP